MIFFGICQAIFLGKLQSKKVMYLVVF